MLKLYYTNMFCLRVTLSLEREREIIPVVCWIPPYYHVTPFSCGPT